LKSGEDSISATCEEVSFKDAFFKDFLKKYFYLGLGFFFFAEGNLQGEKYF